MWVTDTLNLFPEKWQGTSSSKGQPPGLWTQSPRGQTWQSQQATLLGSTEMLPHTGHPPGLGFQNVGVRFYKILLSLGTPGPLS